MEERVDLGWQLSVTGSLFFLGLRAPSRGRSLGSLRGIRTVSSLLGAEAVLGCKYPEGQGRSLGKAAGESRSEMGQEEEEQREEEEAT